MRQRERDTERLRESDIQRQRDKRGTETQRKAD